MALVFEVKGNVCHDIRRFLAEASHEANYLDMSMDGRMDMEPAVRTTDSPDHAYVRTILARIPLWSGDRRWPRANKPYPLGGR